MRRPQSPLRPFALFRARLLLRRRPVLWWLAVLGLSLVVGLTVDGSLSRAEADARRFGPPVEVAVARVDLAAGALAGPATVELRPWPEYLVPAGALRVVPDDRVVTQPLLAGEPVVAERLGTDSLVPANSRALALPTGPGALGVRAGDRVDLLATFDPLVAPGRRGPDGDRRPGRHGGVGAGPVDHRGGDRGRGPPGRLRPVPGHHHPGPDPARYVRGR